MSIDVYTKSSCPQCFATKRALTKKGVAFCETDVSADKRALSLVTSLGHLSAPVVVVSDDDQILDHWSGYRPDKISSLG